MAKVFGHDQRMAQAAITGIDRVDEKCFGVTEFDRLTKKHGFPEKSRSRYRCTHYPDLDGPDVSQIIDLRDEQ